MTWREGVVVNFDMKEDKADPACHGGITILITVGEKFSKILNGKVGKMLEKKEKSTR